jgi:hypothetical protein
MNILEQLSNNKGTVSSALGKTLAQKVLTGDQTDILLECIEFASYDASNLSSKHIRSGAAKVVELVAEQKPELVAPYLEKLIPALAVKEPQTRWMTIRTMGYCAHLNKPIALIAIGYAEKYLENKEGLVIASSADLFLGDLGAISKNEAHLVFPILQLSMENGITNEQDWLLEACYKLFQQLEPAEQETVLMFAERWQYSSRKSTQQRARKILRLRK